MLCPCRIRGSCLNCRPYLTGFLMWRIIYKMVGAKYGQGGVHTCDLAGWAPWEWVQITQSSKKTRKRRHVAIAKTFGSVIVLVYHAQNHKWNITLYVLPGTLAPSIISGCKPERCPLLLMHHKLLMLFFIFYFGFWL